MRNPSMTLPSLTSGMDATATPFTPSRFGAVKISSVGMLAIKTCPPWVRSPPACQKWVLGSSIVRSVPREFV